jgi:hypothetical protein
LLQEVPLARGIGMRHTDRVLLTPDLRDELEPAVEQPHEGAIVLGDQLAQLFQPVKGARGDGSSG